MVQEEPQPAVEVVVPQEQPAIPEQPQQPTQPQPAVEVVAPQDQPAIPEQPAVPQQPQQPTPVVRPRPQAVVVPPHMRWAQFILPSVNVQQPQRPQQNTTVRRWAPVTPPIRFAGTIRVY